MSRKISVSLCSGRTAFEVNIYTRIDLNRAAEMIKARVATPHILIIDMNGAEISLFPAGRMLVKRVKTEKEALKVAENLLAQINW